MMGQKNNTDDDSTSMTYVSVTNYIRNSCRDKQSIILKSLLVLFPPELFREPRNIFKLRTQGTTLEQRRTEMRWSPTCQGNKRNKRSLGCVSGVSLRVTRSLCGWSRGSLGWAHRSTTEGRETGFLSSTRGRGTLGQNYTQPESELELNHRFLLW